MLSSSLDESVSVEILALDQVTAPVLEAWRRLALLTAAPPIAHPEFLIPWAHHRLRPNENSALLVARDEGEVVGLLPVMRGDRRFGGLTVRTLSHLGRNAYVPGVTALIAPACPGAIDLPPAVATALVCSALDLGDWDLLQFNSFAADGVFARALGAQAARRRLRTSPMAHEGGVRVDLSGGWEAVGRGTSRRRSRQLRRLVDSFTQQGWVSREVCDEAEVPEAMNQTFEIASRSWQGQQGTSIASDQAARRFYRELAQVMARSGRLSLWLLTRQQRPVAFLFCLIDGDRAFALKTGFDSSQKHLGPGVLVHGCAMRGLAARGVLSLELFHPASDDKRRWGPEIAPHDGIRVFAPTLRGRMLGAGEQVRRLVR